MLGGDTAHRLAQVEETPLLPRPVGQQDEGNKASTGPHDETDGVEDLNPTPNTPAHRTWTWPTFALVWTSSILNPGSISCGAALLALGLNWWEATLSHFIGGLITLGLLCLTAWPGVRYGIPFPVLARSSFGHRGAHFCTLSRGAVAVMWLSFEMWAGALGLFTGIGRAAGASFLNWGRLDAHLTVNQLLLLTAFAALHIALIRVGIGRVRQLVYLTTPAQLALFTGIAVWACRLAPLEQSLPSSTMGSASAWLTSINASIATWSTLVLNVADMSRLCPTQRDQIIGQSLGMPIPFAVTGWIGIVAAGATRVTLGVAMWQIPEYFEAWHPAWALLGCLVFAASALVVNVTANLLSPMNDLLNLAPDRFDFKWCGYVCVVASIAVCPWWTFSSQTGFIQLFLNGYGMVTGAIAGVIITDFWLLRDRVLHLQDLYPPAPHPGQGAGAPGADSSHKPPCPAAALEGNRGGKGALRDVGGTPFQAASGAPRGFEARGAWAPSLDPFHELGGEGAAAASVPLLLLQAGSSASCSMDGASSNSNSNLALLAEAAPGAGPAARSLDLMGSVAGDASGGDPATAAGGGGGGGNRRQSLQIEGPPLLPAGSLSSAAAAGPGGASSCVDFQGLLVAAAGWSSDGRPPGQASLSSGASHPVAQTQTYEGGANWRAFAAVVAGVAPCVPGFVASLQPEGSGASGDGVPQGLVQLYNSSFMFALLVSGAVFWGLTLLVPPAGFRLYGMRLNYSPTNVPRTWL